MGSAHHSGPGGVAVVRGTRPARKLLKGGSPPCASSAGTPTPVVLNARVGVEAFEAFVRSRIKVEGPASQREARILAGQLFAISAYHGASVGDPLYGGVQAEPPFSGELSLGNEKLVRACHDHMLELEFVPAFDLQEVERGSPMLVGVVGTNGSRISFPMEPLVGKRGTRGIAHYLEQRMDRPPLQWPFYAGAQSQGVRAAWKKFAHAK